MPRYYNQPGVALSYVSSYDPSFDNNLINLQNQENQKAMLAVAGMSEREAQIGDVFSRDTKGKQEVVSSFKDKVNRVKEVYNNDLALAAPALASAISKERQNPWYQKNALYNQELERKQKLIDQFGPNILMNKDLPQLGENQSLNNIEMEDIGFDYVNLQHIQQILGQQFGALGKRKKDLGMKDLNNGFMAFGERTGLSQSELAQLKGKNPEFLDSILNESGIEPTDQTRVALSNYVGTWMDTNLAGNDDWREVADPYAMIKWKARETARAKAAYSSSGSYGFPTGVQVNSTNSTAQNFTGAKTVPDLVAKSKTDPYAKAVLNKVYESMPQSLRDKLNMAPGITENSSLIKSIPGFNKLSPENKQQFLADIDSLSASYSDRSWVNEKLLSKNAMIGDLLVRYGLAVNSSNRLGDHIGTASGISKTIFGSGQSFKIGTTASTKQEDDITSKFIEHINKYDDWYENTYSGIKDEANKYLNDKNVMSFTTNTISGRNPEVKNAINDVFYTTIKSAGTDEMKITNVDGKQKNDQLKNLLESGGKVDFVSMDLGSEYQDNKFRVTVSNGTGAKKSSQEFIINPNTENAKEFAFNLAMAADSFGPLDGVYSKLLHEKTFKTGKDKVTINDIAATRVYNQGLPNDPNPLAYIEKNPDGSFVVINKDLIMNGDPNAYYRKPHMTMTQASDDLLEQYGIIPEYRERYIRAKIADLESPAKKIGFLEAQLNMGNISDAEFKAYESLTSEEDYGY